MADMNERVSVLERDVVMALADRITNEWRVYCQALRDLPAQSGFPDVTFQNPPSGA